MKIKKIIRDKIPMVAAEQGNRLPIVCVSNEEAIGLLFNKLHEEVAEFCLEYHDQLVDINKVNMTKLMLEAVDIRDVLDAIIKKIQNVHPIVYENGILDMQRAHSFKSKTNGKFVNNVCLLEHSTEE